MPTLTSDRVNYLVWRYLQEEGLNLSSYAVNKETHIGNLDPKSRSSVPGGELVRSSLKGIELSELESQALDASALPVEAPKAEKPRTQAEKVKGFKNVSEPSMGGVASVCTDKSLIVAGLDKVGVYTREPVMDGQSTDDKNEEPNPEKVMLKQTLECNDRPTVLVKEAMGVIVGYMSGTVRQWRLDSDTPVSQSVLMPELDVTLSPVSLIKRSPSGAKAAVVYLEGLICIWDLVERQMSNSFNLHPTNTKTSTPAGSSTPPHLAMVSDLTWSNGDTTVAVGHAQGVTIFNLESPATPTFLTRNSESIKPTSVSAYDPIMQLSASGSDDGNICIWNSGANTPSREIKAGQVPAPVSHVSWLGVYSLTGATDGSSRVFDVRKATAPSEIVNGTSPDDSVTLVAAANLNEPVLGVEIQSQNYTNWDSVQLAVLTPVGVRIFNFAQSKFTLVGSVDENGVQSVACSPLGFAVTTRESTIVLQ